METTDRLKVEKSQKSGQDRKWVEGVYLQIFICHLTCVAVLQCRETPGMFVVVVGGKTPQEDKEYRLITLLLVLFQS